MNSNNFYKYKFLTQKAFEFQPKIMSGKIMNFTKAEIGDGILTGIEEAKTLQSLKNKICDVKILSIVPKGHMVELTLLLDGEGLSEVTLYREIGIYAQIDEEEVLYAYLNSDDKFDYIIPIGESNTREFTNNKIKITLVVGNAENIEVILNNTIIPDDSITMDMLTIEVKDYIDDIKSKTDKVISDFDIHTKTSIISEDGIHGIKYDESERTLKYKKDDSWENIPTGQEVETEINEHKEKSILGEDGVHNLKYDKENNKFKYKESESWHDIDTGESAKNELNTHKGKKVSDIDGIHGIRFNEEIKELEIKKENSEWIEIEREKATADLSPVTNIKIKNGNGKLYLSWSDPPDGEWEGTKVIYKVGGYPETPKDGIILIDNKVKDKYKEIDFEINGLTNDIQYYFTFFPYDIKNKYNINPRNKVIGNPKAYKIMTVMIDKSNSNPETCCTYSDDSINITSDEWDKFIGHYPCLLKDGREIGKLKKDDFTKFEDGTFANIESGADGDVMIAFPVRKIRSIIEGIKFRLSVTDDLNIDNYDFKNIIYNNSNIEKCFYVGAYKGSIIDGKLRSLSNRVPTTNITIDQARAYAQANGIGYNQLKFYPLTYLQIMYLLKYKNLNSQQCLGRGYVSNSTGTIITGGTNTKGMDWGEDTGKYQMKLFGIEDFWGNCLDWIDDLAIRNNRLLIDQKDFGEINVNSGYISSVYGGERYFVPETYNGSESTYYTDFCITSNNSVGDFGGAWNNTNISGAFRLNISHVGSNAYSYIGARLIYLQED